MKNIRKHVGEIALFPFLLVLIVLLLAIIFARTKVGAQYVQKETDVSLSEMTPPIEVLEHEVEEVEEVEQSEVSASVETVEEAVVQTEPEIVAQPAAPVQPAQPAVPTQPVAPVQPTVIEQPEISSQPIVEESVELAEEAVGASEDDDFVAFEPRTMYVLGHNVSERLGPNLNSAIIVNHLAGETVTVVGFENNWYRLSNGNYMSVDYLTDNPADIVPHFLQSYSELIVIDISDQYVTYYKDGEILKSGPCITGDAQKSPTPIGLYSVWCKRHDFYMNNNPNTHAYYFTAFNRGIGFHDAHWRNDVFGGDIYKTNGSLGCINMELEFAKTIYDNTVIGTKVLVLP